MGYGGMMCVCLWADAKIAYMIWEEGIGIGRGFVKVFGEICWAFGGIYERM